MAKKKSAIGSASIGCAGDPIFEAKRWLMAVMLCHDLSGKMERTPNV